MLIKIFLFILEFLIEKALVGFFRKTLVFIGMDFI